MDEEKELLRHRGLIVSQVKRFKASRVVDRHDYEQVATIALLRAIREYDPARGRFGNFATCAIRNALLNEFRRFRNRDELLEEDRAYEQPEPFWELLPELTKGETRILKMKLANCTNNEIAQKIGSNRESVRERLLEIKKKIRQANAQ